MHCLFLMLCATVAATAHYLGEFPPVVIIPWRKSLIPCECSGSTLDCSERCLSSLETEHLSCHGAISSVDLFDNCLLQYPDGLQDAVIVNASRNRLQRAPITSQLNEHITMLDLSENSICDVDLDYRQLVSLHTLRFSKNCLQNLLFLPQPCLLATLEIASNRITGLDTRLSQCTLLQILDISDNNISLLHEDIFAELTQLTTLDLSWNPIISFPSNIFATLRFLKDLRLDGTGLETIPEGFFDNLSQLEYLSLDGNSLTSIQGTTFSSLASLVYLSISKNKLRSFSVESVSNLLSLEELHIAGNELTLLPANAFASLPHLKFINADANNLSSLPADVFSGLDNLDTVFLRSEGTPLVLPVNLFLNLSSLQLLSISSQNFQPEFLKTLLYVPYLQCYRCGITELPPRAFAELSQTKALSIELNNISFLANNALEGLSHLVYLSLGGNDIVALPEIFFSPILQLTRLHLWDNRLSSLPEGIFSGMRLLTELTLNQNMLTQLPENIFHGLNSLRRLDLSNNLLVSLPDNVFANLSALWELNLANNRLTVLPSYDPSCVSLKAVSFEENFTNLDQTALRSWLFSNNEMYVNLAGNSSEFSHQYSNFSSQYPGVKLEMHMNNNRMSVRRENTLLRLTVNSGDLP